MFEGASPLQTPTSPLSPLKERGIKGVRLIIKSFMTSLEGAEGWYYV